MKDRMAKQKLNVIVMVDCSKSMQGERIAQVNAALRDIKAHLVDLQDENANVDFYMTVITFSTGADFLNGDRCKAVEDFAFKDIKCAGWSNLHLGYQKLEEILKKESKGGIMPDFGGVAPIVLLMTDGHPTKYPLTEETAALKKLPWYKVALKYGIAIALKDERTHKVLDEFVDGNGDVLECYDAKLLKRMIQIIVLTASKVKSKSASMSADGAQSVVQEVRQEVRGALMEIDDWEW